MDELKVEDGELPRVPKEDPLRLFKGLGFAMFLSMLLGVGIWELCHWVLAP